jgi:hypothetical protein
VVKGRVEVLGHLRRTSFTRDRINLSKSAYLIAEVRFSYLL